MTEVCCKGSFALGTACGHCPRCVEQIEAYKSITSVKDKLNTPSSALREIRELKAERDALQAKLDRAHQILREVIDADDETNDHTVASRSLRDIARVSRTELKGTNNDT